MDILMPVMDGLTATQRLRHLPGVGHVPVIVVSAGASELDAQRSMQVGASAFIAKPIDFDELLRHIGTLLHVSWRHPKPFEPDTPAQPGMPTGPMVVPPPAEVETLYKLARIGNMRSIRVHADKLAAQDARYSFFAQRLSLLASRFQSRAIMELIEQYREEGATP
jgi:CheY-like chemotaxis protein